MEDPQIHGTIEQLVAEKHELWDRESGGNAIAADRQRLRQAQGLARAVLGPAAPTPRPPGCRARPGSRRRRAGRGGRELPAVAPVDETGGQRDAGIAVLRPDGVGAERPDAAAGVPAHGDGRRRGPAGRGRRGAGLGEHRRVVVRLALGDDALDRRRRRGRRARPARVGQQRADDVLLLRRRAGGATGVRSRRAARAAAVRAAAARRDRRDGGRRSRSISPSTPDASSAHGWGVAMSTDTAFALGLLALVGPRFPDRLRAFMLTVVVVDDILALVVIAIVYTDEVALSALLVALGLFGVVLVAQAFRRARRPRLLRSRGGDLGRAPRVGRRPGRRRTGDGPSRLRLPGARSTSSVRPSGSASSASSRPPSSRAPSASGSGPRSRRTSGCSCSTTRGRAT